MRCAARVPEETLLAWWTGELEAAERDRVEAHLLGCDECAAYGHEVAAVAGGIRDLVRDGEVPTVLLPAVVERLQREGRRLREYRVQPLGRVECTVSPDDDVVLARLVADLEGVSRLDLAIRVDDGPEERLTDLPFDAGAGEIAFAPSADALRRSPSHVQRLRLLAVDARGETILGEYAFHHTPWPGG